MKRDYKLIETLMKNGWTKEDAEEAERETAEVFEALYAFMRERGFEPVVE